MFITLLGLNLLMAAPVMAAEGPTTGAGSPKLSDFVAQDFCAAIIIHPSQMAKSPVAQAMGMGQTQSVPGAPAGAALEAAFLQKIKPEKVRRAVILLDPTSSGTSQASPGTIVQFEEETDIRKLLTETYPDVATVTV